MATCRAGSAIPLSIDHKPDRYDERQGIEDAGGFVIWAGTWRVGGVLAISRAFGDKLLKAYVVANPKIQEEEIDGVDFIIITSDGLWNVFPNKEAVMEIEVLGLPMMTRDMGLSWSPSPSLLMEGLMPLMPITLIAHTRIEPAHLAASILSNCQPSHFRNLFVYLFIFIFIFISFCFILFYFHIILAQLKLN